MSKLGAVIAVLGLIGLAGCATAPAELSMTCPAGQEAHRTAQLFFGSSAGDQPKVTEAAFRAFVDKELTPRFPDGLSVLDGGGRWRGDENKLIRDASKVVLIVLPKGRDAAWRVEAVRSAYRSRFHQDSVLLVTPASCISL